jgi:hypothetical protein
MDEFRRGLKDNVKDMLVNMSRPTNLSELQNQAIDADYRIFERILERKKDNHQISYQKTSDPVGGNSNEPSPMQVDAQQVPRRRGPLTPEEKQRRKDSNLCLYCGAATCGGVPDVNKCSKAPPKRKSVGFST